MASTASTSAFTRTASINGLRSQAGPLPSKRGEIGYREDLHKDLERGSEEDSRSIVELPARHPADRDENDVATADTDIPLTPAARAESVSQHANASHDTSSTHSMGKRSIIKFLTIKRKNLPTYGGIRLTTLLTIITQALLIGATITGWALAVYRINQESNNSDDPNKSGAQIGNSIIFFHVLFLVALVGQLIFFERRLFRLRAERYAYLHHGELLPTARRHSSGSMSFAPWHRPPLPTYAASLAQSGHGTGDVEDNIIAVPPPPAYGQTRNSRLLLSGFLRNSLRAQRPVSEHSQMSLRNDRPLSYVSHDERLQEVQDAQRARELEQTLSSLEAEGAIPTASTSMARS